MEQEHIRTLKILWSMSEFGGLWKHSNNPACTEYVRAFQVLMLDAILKKIWKNNLMQTNG